VTREDELQDEVVRLRERVRTAQRERDHARVELKMVQACVAFAQSERDTARAEVERLQRALYNALDWVDTLADLACECACDCDPGHHTDDCPLCIACMMLGPDTPSTLEDDEDDEDEEVDA
jgi:hypothetical protein